MYTIYEIKGVKIGVTTNFTKRQKRQKDLGEMIVLEDHIDIYKASERERELQAEKGYKVDKTPYWHVVQVMLERSKTPQAKKKRVDNTDYLNIQSHRKRGVVAIDPDGIETVYSGMAEASRQLTEKTGIKFYQGVITNVCKGLCKTSRGYTFKYA